MAKLGQVKKFDCWIYYEGSSELFDKLSKPENTGKTLCWFNQEDYSDDWFLRQNKSKLKI